MFDRGNTNLLQDVEKKETNMDLVVGCSYRPLLQWCNFAKITNLHVLMVSKATCPWCIFRR